MGLDVANLLLKISGDPDDAKRALSEVTAELKKFGTVEAQAKVGIDGFDEAKAKLDDLDKSLTVIGHRNVTAKVKIDTAQAKAELARLRAELDLSSRKGAGARPSTQIFGDIDQLGQHIESTFHTRFEKVGKDVHKVFESMKRDFVGTVGAGIGSIVKAAPAAAASGLGAVVEGGGAAVKGIATLGTSAVSAVGPMAALLALVVAFVPALLALTASLAGAIAGFSVLAVSFVGVLAPALILVVGALKELVQSYQAVNQRQEQAKSSALAVAQAQQGVHTATEQLSSAQHNLKLQTEEAYTAWRAQIRAVHEDLLGVKSAQLGVEGAQLSYKNALQALKEFRSSIGLEGGKFDDLFKKFTNVDFDPKKILKSIKDAGGGNLGKKQDLELQGLILAIKQAKLGEAQAQEALHGSNEKLEKDRKQESRYLKEGIKAYPAYLSALKEVRLAQEGMVTAGRSLQQAQISQARGLGNITKEQLTLGTFLNKFVKQLKELFGPATKEIFKGFEAGLKSIFGLLKDTGLSSAFKNLGRAIGGVFATLGKTLSSPDMRKNLTELVKGSGQLVKTLGSAILINFIRLFTHLAVAAMPAMLKIVERIGAAFKRWADSSSNVDKLRAKIHHIIDEFEKWMKLIGALGALIAAFFRDSSRQGDGLAVSITKILEKWTKFLDTKQGQEEIKNFLRESINFGKEFIEVVKGIIEVVKALGTVIGPVVEAVSGVGGYIGQKYGEQVNGLNTPSPEDQRRTKIENIDSINNQLKTGKNTQGHPLTSANRKSLEKLRNDIMKQVKGHQHGGLIGNLWGGGDKLHILAEAGEFMLRKEVVNSVGRSALERLNATGVLPSKHTAGKGGDTFIDKIVLPAVPGHAGIDPTVAAVKFARELSKRGLG